MLTINNIKKSLNDYATAHAQINSFLFGIPPDKDPDTATEYPQLWCVIVSSEIQEDQEAHSIEFIVWDQPSDENNKDQATEALSDTKSIANDTVAFIKNNYADIDIDLPVSMEPLYEVGEDGCYGWKFTINLRLNQGLDLCSVPISGVSPEYHGQVLILNQDGDILSVLNPGQTYTVEELQAVIDTITNNTGAIIDPIS